MKPTRIKIPKGCEYITFEQIGDTIVTSFNEDKEFKIGDVCVDENNAKPFIFVFGGYDGKYPKRYADVWVDGSGCMIFPIAKNYGEKWTFVMLPNQKSRLCLIRLQKLAKCGMLKN